VYYLNKILLATENTPGHFSSVGLYIDAGARYETPSNSEVSHFLDRMAFKLYIRCSKRGYNMLILLQSTQSMSDSDMVTAMNALGGQILCSSARETIMYRSSHFHRATQLAFSLIFETVQNASSLPEELLQTRHARATRRPARGLVELTVWDELSPAFDGSPARQFKESQRFQVSLGPASNGAEAGRFLICSSLL
jgi:Insulinase (Peptidase family M16)